MVQSNLMENVNTNQSEFWKSIGNMGKVGICSKIPTDWGKCSINPIPKSSTTDPRDPLS